MPAVVCLAALLASCGGDDYHYPSVKEEFYTLHTGRDGLPESILTDGGSEYRVVENKSYYSSTPDTTLRAVGYYEETAGGVILYSPSPAISHRPIPAEAYADSASTAPVALQSIWPGLDYLNIVLQVKNNGGHHSLVFLEDSVVTAAGGVKSVYVSIYHNAHGDAEGYTSRAYLSLPLSVYLDASTDELDVSVSFLNYGQQTETHRQTFKN